MMVGHYGVALMLKRANKKLNIGWLFLASMLPDMLLGIFVLAGLEKVFIPNDYPKLHYLLFDFPYSHGLAATILWSIFIFTLVILFWPKIKSEKILAASILVLAFASHFLLDVLVHVPEIPVFGDNSAKLGFSLWNTYPLALVVEILIAQAGLINYLTLKRGKSMKSKIGVSIVIIILSIFTAGQLFSSSISTDTLKIVPFQWIVSVIIVSSLVFWLDYEKTPKLK